MGNFKIRGESVEIELLFNGKKIFNLIRQKFELCKKFAYDSYLVLRRRLTNQWFSSLNNS